MFVFNIKFSKRNVAKLLLILMITICISLLIIEITKIFKSKNEIVFFNENCMPENGIAYLTDKNYTNILKEVHENLDTYIGQKISYTGYVYRIPEINSDEFILARDMKVNEQTDQTVIVGFLCKLENAQNFDDYTWVNITGSIEKGEFFGEIPCIHISEINTVSKPENSIVPKPDDNFIQTATIY